MAPAARLSSDRDLLLRSHVSMALHVGLIVCDLRGSEMDDLVDGPGSVNSERRALDRLSGSMARHGCGSFPRLQP